jgi:Cu+-exporting ATPase
MESAGVTLVKGDVAGIVRAIHLSRATMANIRQNLFLAFIYNALSVPVAAGAFYPLFGWTLNPIIASAAIAVLVRAMTYLRGAFIPRVVPCCQQKIFDSIGH